VPSQTYSPAEQKAYEAAERHRDKAIVKAREALERAVLTAQAAYDRTLARANQRLGTAIEAAREAYRAEEDTIYTRHHPRGEG